MGGMQCDVRKDDHVREIMGYIRRRCMRRMISVRGQQEIARYRLSGVERSPALYTLQTKGNERVSSVILCSLFPGDPG